MTKPAIQWTLFSIVALLMIMPIQSAAGQVGVAGSRNRQGYVSSQIMNLLYLPKIQKEIEIIPEQLEKINKLRTKLNEARRDAYKDASKLPVEVRQKAVQEVYANTQADAMKEMNEILLPHQLNRLKEVVLQYAIKSSFAYTLTQDEIAESIELNEEQIAELSKKELELNREMTKKAQEFYNKMRAENREKLMEVLTEKQRRKLQSLLGEKYDWSPAAKQ